MSAPAVTRRGWALLGALLAWSMTLFMGLLALGDALIVLEGRPATATVLAAGPLEPGRTGGRRYPVRLRIEGEVPVEAWAERAMRLRGGWSDPEPPPRPGDRIAVYLAPPDRIVPVSAVASLWSWVFPLGLACTISAAALMALRSVWRSDGASGGTRHPDP
jgi:hypothetical protein